MTQIFSELVHGMNWTRPPEKLTIYRPLKRWSRAQKVAGLFSWATTFVQFSGEYNFLIFLRQKSRLYHLEVLFQKLGVYSIYCINNCRIFETLEDASRCWSSSGGTGSSMQKGHLLNAGKAIGIRTPFFFWLPGLAGFRGFQLMGINSQVIQSRRFYPLIGGHLTP